MIRFFKELKYSLKMRIHLLFILMIIMGLVSAVYLFRESLQGTLEKAFPGDYGKVSEVQNKFRIAGEYNPTATAKDVDIQAELTLNGALHSADWMKYEEAFLYNDLYVKKYTGTDKALVGFGTDKQDASKDVEIERGKYSRIKSAWISEEILKAEGFGGAVDRMFDGENSYIDTMYVVLGSGMESDQYTAGGKLTLRVENMQIDAVILGFLKPGATMKVGDRVVCLDYYIVCPLLDLSGLYDEEQEEKHLPTNTDPVFLPEAMVKNDSPIADKTATPNQLEADGKKYSAAKCLWLAEDDIAQMETVPEWLTTLRGLKTSDGSYNFYAGRTYETEKLFARGSNINAQTLYEGAKKFICCGFIEEGAKITVNGAEVLLDDKIVIVLHNKTTDTPATTENNNETGETGEKTDTPAAPAGKTFEAGERMLLFRLLVLKNSCYINTNYSADETERKLESLLASSWDNYKKDNPTLTRTSEYKIREADKPGSVVYRENIREVPGKLKKIDAPGYYICIILLALYFFYKFFRGSDYYTTLIMTGDTKIEIVLLFAVEAAILCAVACGLGFVLSWVVAKLLRLGAVAAAPIISKNVRIVLIPLIAVSVVIVLRDYGKIFRRR